MLMRSRHAASLDACDSALIVPSLSLPPLALSLSFPLSLSLLSVCLSHSWHEHESGVAPQEDLEQSQDG